MKIYEIATGYTPIPARIGAATEIVVEELTKAFLKQAVPVEIIDIAAAQRPQTNLSIREVKVPKRFSGTDIQLGLMHKMKRVVYSIALAGELKQILNHSEEKIVLHFHNQYNLFFFLKIVPKKLREKCLIAYTNHSGVWRQEWEKIEETIKKRYFQEIECMKCADIVFLLNQETKQNVIDHLGVDEKRISLINNGVNTDVYHPLTQAEKEEAKAAYGLKGCRIILQVGSVCENKGQLRAVAYLTPLLKKNPDLIYAYAGGVIEEIYHAQIQDFARENNLAAQVRYLGMISPGTDLNRLYNTAVATVVPSIFEGFSLVSIESLAAGVPVLVDKAGPVNVGDGCISFDKQDFESTVSCLLEKDLAGLHSAARENAERNFSWDSVAKDYFDVFSRQLKVEN